MSSRARKTAQRKVPVMEQSLEQERLRYPDLQKLLTSELYLSSTVAARQKAPTFPAPAPGGRVQIPRKRAGRGLNLCASASPIIRAGLVWRCTPSQGSATSSPSARGACRATRTLPELSAPTVMLPQLRHLHRRHRAPLARVRSRRGPTLTTSQ